jgi:hypothetical protein
MSESRMREIRLSGSMSGKWKRSTVAILRHSQTKERATGEHKLPPKPPRHFSTLLVTEVRGVMREDGSPYPAREHFRGGRTTGVLNWGVANSSQTLIFHTERGDESGGFQFNRKLAGGGWVGGGDTENTETQPGTRRSRL